jgi:hypothetical protein
MRHREQEEKFNGTIEVISASILHAKIFVTIFLWLLTYLEAGCSIKDRSTGGRQKKAGKLSAFFIPPLCRSSRRAWPLQRRLKAFLFELMEGQGCV